MLVSRSFLICSVAGMLMYVAPCCSSFALHFSTASSISVSMIRPITQPPAGFTLSLRSDSSPSSSSHPWQVLLHRLTIVTSWLPKSSSLFTTFPFRSFPSKEMTCPSSTDPPQAARTKASVKTAATIVTMRFTYPFILYLLTIVNFLCLIGIRLTGLASRAFLITF